MTNLETALEIAPHFADFGLAQIGVCEMGELYIVSDYEFSISAETETKLIKALS